MKGVINMSKRQRIDASREVRLWIGQVIVPGVVGLMAIDQMHPELKYKVSDKYRDVKSNIKNKFKK